MDEYDGNDSNEELNDSIPLDIELTEGNATNHSLPPKSLKKYNMCYDQFMQWKSSNDINEISEKVMLSYFNELKGKFQATTLWSHFSMLRSTLLSKDNINIRSYTKLIQFLKQNREGFQSKKSGVFQPADLKRFFEKAPNKEYLMEKVVAIFGICGGCRVDELTNIKVDDVKDRTDVYVIDVANVKDRVPRQFMIGKEFYKIVKKYVELRPKDAGTTRFFLTYRNGKCMVMHLGRNKMGLVPKKIAQYLKLSNPELYTGYSFKRIPPTLMDHGADLTPSKRHGLRKVDKFDVTSIENSIQKIAKIENHIVSAIGQQGNVDEEQGQKEFHNQTLVINTDSSESNTAEDKQTVQSSSNKQVKIALYNCTIIIQK